MIRRWQTWQTSTRTYYWIEIMITARILIHEVRCALFSHA